MIAQKITELTTKPIVFDCHHLRCLDPCFEITMIRIHQLNLLIKCKKLDHSQILIDENSKKCCNNFIFLQ